MHGKLGKLRSEQAMVSQGLALVRASSARITDDLVFLSFRICSCLDELTAGCTSGMRLAADVPRAVGCEVQQQSAEMAQQMDASLQHADAQMSTWLLPIPDLVK